MLCSSEQKYFKKIKTRLLMTEIIEASTDNKCYSWKDAY